MMRPAKNVALYRKRVVTLLWQQHVVDDVDHAVAGVDVG